MKKQFVSLLVLLLATSGLFFSCTNTANNNTGALEFDSIQVNTTEHLFGDTAKPACNLVINLSYATESNDVRLKDSLNSYLFALTLGEKYIGLDAETAVKNYTDMYVSTNRKDLEPMYRKDEAEQEDGGLLGAWYSYYKKLDGRVQFYQKNLLVYSSRYEEYTGGAHGIYMTSFLNMNLNTLTPIRLSDLFVNEYEEALTDLLWNQLMADNRATTRQELEEMGYATTGELTPTENFYLDNEGITFYYNVYDIAPYVMGPIKICLPYDAVEHLLNGENSLINSIRK